MAGIGLSGEELEIIVCEAPISHPREKVGIGMIVERREIQPRDKNVTIVSKLMVVKQRD